MKIKGPHNGQKKKENNDLQNITQKAKERASKLRYKPEVNPGAPEGLAVL